MGAIRYILLGVIVATGGLWVAGQFWWVLHLGRALDVCIAAGGFSASRVDPTGPFTITEFRSWMILPSNHLIVANFPMPGVDSDGWITVPFWCILVACIPPWFILHRRHREQRRRAMVGACASCGYDLTGNESGVCSECGEAVMVQTDAKGTT